ncbi:GAF domain-containing protein [Halobaculum marinum]|uniref:histidine kinase n=1 Tax=Halobaculum marinum TaxID=3031996 RepID=A0ABD5WV88_9EURY|nr:GAF domain-containing protein [Halobaculum sp. DT55]
MADSLAEPSRLVLVVADESAAVPDGLVGGLGESVEGVATDVATPAALRDPLEAGDRLEAVVLVNDPHLPDDVVDLLATTRVCVIAYAETEPAADYVDGYVDAGTGAERLAEEIARARVGETRRQLRAARRRVTELHAGTARLAATESVPDLFERAIEVAERILAFDHCSISVREGDNLVSRARSTDADWLRQRVPIDESIAGRAILRDETIHVEDVTADESATDATSGSGISVPFGGDAVFQAVSRQSHAFDETDRELAELLTTHVGQAYERLRAEADLTRRERVMAELHEAAPRLVDADSEAELFELTTEIAQRVLSFDRSCVYTLEGDQFRLRATTDPDLPTAFPRGFGALGYSHAEKASLVSDDVVADSVAESHDGESRSLISVPFAEDAVFQAVTDATGAFDERDLEFAELLVSYATATRERIRSEAALREARRVTEQLHDSAADLAAADDEQALIDRAIQAAQDVLSFAESTISLREGDKLVPVATSEETLDGASRPMNLDEGVGGRTYRTGESIIVDDVAEHDDADPVRAEYRSGLSVPIGTLGVFQAVSTEPGAFDRDDLNNAELLMTHVAVSLERLRTEADLRSERDRLSALFENVPDAAVSFELADGDPVARAINSAFTETFGYGEEMIGESIDEYIVPGDAEEEAIELNERLRHGESIRRECRRETVDGVRDFLMYVVPLELGAENIGGYAIYSDITERRERERALQRQNERLDEFASVVSHDLRNPLSIAEGYLDLAQETGEDEHLQTVGEAIERMRTLIDDLLRLAREGRVVGETTAVELDDTARGAWRIVDTADASLAVDGGVVDADPDRLSELFENLFRNAVEHGGDDVHVTVEPIPGGFAVADDGPGVSPDRRDDVFEAGVSTAENGTGFGLAIVRRIADAHGWAVTLVEGEDGGARFEFTTRDG